jgi:hypothetical protein
LEETRVNGRPPASSLRSSATIEDQPLKHVIDTYVHREQTITCVCGWHGSCAPGDRGASPWTAHLQEFRTKKR